MPAEYENCPECRWIEQFVRELAPSIDSVQCGRQPSGDYELWLRLLPGSKAQQLLLTEDDYRQGQGEAWKKRIEVTLNRLNS